MKKLFLSALFGFFLSTIAFGQLNFGAGAQLIFDGTVFGLQGKALYNVNEQWRGTGTFTVHLEDGANWSIDLDAHYKILKVGENINIAPMAGLNIFSSEGLDGNTSNIGINLGAFIDFPIQDESLNLFVEPKITIDNYESFVLSAGVIF